MCIVLPGTSFLCVDPKSLDFEDSNGGTGNLTLDTYTMLNGAVTSLASTMTTYPTPTSFGSKLIGTALTSGTKATFTGTAAAAKATSSGRASNAGSSGGAVTFKVNGIFGMISMVVGAVGAFF